MSSGSARPMFLFRAGFAPSRSQSNLSGPFSHLHQSEHSKQDHRPQPDPSPLFLEPSKASASGDEGDDLTSDPPANHNGSAARRHRRIAPAGSVFSKMSSTSSPSSDNESPAAMSSSPSQETTFNSLAATPTASTPSTPKKRSNASSAKKEKLSSSAKGTPRKVSTLKPSSSGLGDSEKVPTRQSVVVCVRMRPAKASDDSEQNDAIWSFDQQQNQIVPTEHHPSLAKRVGSSSTNTGLPTAASATDLGEEVASSSTYKFQFDKLLLGNDTTDDMYDSQIAPVVQAAMDGYNGTVFAYGQTGSGKTHTMSGNETEPGVIPRAVQQVFKTIEAEPSREFLLRVSYLEIYNETLKDLLAPLSGGHGPAEATRPASPTKGGLTHSAGHSQSSSLRIVEDQKSSRVMITGLREEIVTDPRTVLDLIQKGQEARHVGATDWNERSSRSHCVFQVTIESRSKTESSADASKAGAEVRVSQLNLIDLAGSERAASQAERRKEGAFINKSLLTLGTVIAKLTEPSSLSGSSSDLHIPYRDSKLTRILQTSLSGNARIAVICTLSPDVKHAVETLSTLKFGKRCKMVVTSAKKGTSMDDKALLQKYRKELDALRAKLEAGPGASPIALVEDKEMLASSRESQQKLEALNQEREKAQKEVDEMEKKRGDLRGQIDHLTRIILTSQSVARERTEGEAGSATNADGTPRKRLGLERRGPRLSDIHAFSLRSSVVSQSPSLESIAQTSTLSGGKPFELEAELTALRKQLRQQIESRQALVAAHQAELASRDAKEKELEEVIRMNEEELDEAEVAYDRLRADRDEARKVALKEQETAREHKRAWQEEQEANRLLKLVAKSRGAEAEEELKREAERLRTQVEEQKLERQALEDKLRAELEAARGEVEQERLASKALQQQLEARKIDTAEDDADQEFQDLVTGNRFGLVEDAKGGRRKAEKLAERERRLEEATQDLERRRAELEDREKAFKPLPIPQRTGSSETMQVLDQAKELEDLKAQLRVAQTQSQVLEGQVARLTATLDGVEAAQAGSRESEAKLVEMRMELEGYRNRVTKLETMLDAEKARTSRPLPVPTMASPSTLAKSTPSSPIKGHIGVSRLRTESEAGRFGGAKGLNRGGSVREYRRYQPSSEDDIFSGNSNAPVGNRSSVLGYKAAFDSLDAKGPAASHRAEREEIERLNAVIQSQRAIMADLEKSVTSWKSRLKAQADLIQKLAASSGAGSGFGSVAAITPPMQDGELPSPVRNGILLTSRALGEIQPLASPSKLSSHFESSRSKFLSGSGASGLESPDTSSPSRYGNTLPRSSKEYPYYGAHTYNRPPTSSTIGLGVLPGSPTKGTSTPTSSGVASLWSHHAHPSPLPPPPSSPTSQAGRRRKPRKTIEHELLALKASPRVEPNKSRFLQERDDPEPAGLKHKTSAAAFYI